MARGTATQYNPTGSGADTSAKAKPSDSVTTEDTDDSISVTSTPYDSEDPDVEYNVEDILAQDDDIDGVTKYLVRWTNYPLEKCTWEPEENMGHDLLRDLWETKKKRRDYKPFDLGLYFGALAEKERRHFRRNMKRKRLGLPETFPFLEREEVAVSEPVAEAETTKDVADAATGTDSVSAVAELLSAMEPTGVNGAETEPADPANDSDDDIVVLDAISAPAAPKTKKKKKKKEVSAKDKTEAASKPLPKHRDVVEAGPARPTNHVSTSLTAPGTLTGKPKRPEKRKSTDGERKTNTAELVKNPKGPPGAVRRMPDQPSSNQPLQQANAPTVVNTKEPASSSKSGQISEASPRNSNTFSARRSATTPQITGNAFSSGKRIRTRSNLVTAMSDPSKPQQLFTSRRTLRQAEIQERDKPDRIIEPSLLSAQLFPISQGPPKVPAPPAKTGNRQDNAIPQPPPASSPELEAVSNLSPAQGPSRSILAMSRPPATAPKRKKSVHFSVPSGGYDESSSNRTLLTSPPAGGFATTEDDDPMMGIEPEKSEVPMPDRAIKLLAGSQKEPVEAVFSVMAEPHSTKMLLDEVFGNNLIRFDYSCLAETLLQQLGGIREKNLFSGNIKASPEKKSSVESLETISQRLMTMNAGLFLLKPSFAILLYPTRCQDWSEEKFGFPVPETEQVIALLRYVVFKTCFDGSSFLRPPSGAAGDFSIPPNVGEREHIMKVFSGLDHGSYARLFPRRDKTEKVKRNIFLTFPPSLSPSMQQLAFWARAMDPSCAIFYCTVPGAWMAFRDKITMDSEDGAIIVHELVLSAIRRFPDLHSFVSAEDGACRIWALSQSISPPIFSPIGQPDLDEPDGGGQSGKLTDFGKVTWTQLFPHGLAIFVTPSFIVSEPRRTYDIFRWISNAHRVGDILVTLVTAWDICGFLRTIADEKYRQRNEKLGGKAQRADPKRREDAARARDSDVDCHLRYETWLLANEICETRETAYFLPNAFADEAIDCNDEQSLVNWFGWWSSMHVDQYRLFHVVGTDMALKYKHSELAVRKITVPIFGFETVADPDVARERTQETIDAMARASDTGGSLQLTPSNACPSLPPQAFRSSRFLDDSPSAYTKLLMNLSSKKNFWRFYGFAIFWRDSNEAFKYGSLQSNPHTINDWFTFTWPFIDMGFRTYIGFFYMVNDSCDELRADQSDKLARHPFVVIYRPEQPNKFPFMRTELIFWDPRAKNKFRGRDLLYEASDLTAGQRAVLDHIREFGPEKNKRLPLSRIYIGGEPYKRGNDRHGGALPPSLNELDATAEYLEHLARDIKNMVPPTTVYLEAKGFKEVVMSGDRREDRSIESRNPGEMMATTGGEDNAKIVFHAPRGERMRHIGSSKCRNRFYDTARQARMRNPRSTTMEFEYRPTTEWYLEQVEEGRGHDHIRVDSWEAFFETFKVGKS